MNLTQKTGLKKETKKTKQRPPGERSKECNKVFSGPGMGVRKEKKCFSLCYAKTQLIDYVRHVQELFGSQKNMSQTPQTIYHQYVAYPNNPNEPRIQETQKKIEVPRDCRKDSLEEPYEEQSPESARVEESSHQIYCTR